MPRAILFDMDGVLVTSGEVWFRCIQAAAVRFGAASRPAITRAEFFPTFGQDTAADLTAFGLACTVEELDSFYTAELARHLDEVRVNPEAAPLLEALAHRGLALGVVTNTVGPLAREILTRAGLLRLVTSLSTADRVEHAKPAPDLVHLGCRELGVAPEEAWLVGDSQFDRSAAAAAGVRFVGLGLDAAARIERLGEVLALLPP